ncbi:MAG: class I SAM-dependent rRNA methyltransferase [Acidobacteria bacterium]|nr:class I SAM-dependent rRNA methyltransferase [Acidobacteriota bacterium]MBV9479038.1 class I SAM-dependent rRNA methyltransferase [Acidobacteriota bacterium]
MKSDDDAFARDRRRQLVLKRGKERVAANRHPWIFAGALHAERGPEDAALADLVDASGARIASGFYSKQSQIRLRALTFGDEELTPELLDARITRAIARRKPIFDDATNAARLIHAEGDDLSSIVVDRYDDVVVVEIGSRGAERLKPLIVDALRRELAPRVIFFKNDLPARALEQLTTTAEQIGDGAPRTTIRESGLRFHVDPAAGQKTGFFLDQRENRRLARTLATGKRALNLFSYSGAFGVYAAAGGASSVTNVDVSAPAIETARENHALNGFDATHLVADAFQYVRQTREQFDLLICDPPAFAKSRHDVERAARGYKDVNLFAMRLVSPGGLMMTFSCSGHMSLDLFQKVLFAAALDAGRRVSFVRRLGAGPDHPVSIYCPEGEYLKGFLLEIH